MASLPSIAKIYSHTNPESSLSHDTNYVRLEGLLHDLDIQMVPSLEHDSLFEDPGCGRSAERVEKSYSDFNVQVINVKDRISLSRWTQDQ